MWRDVWWCEDQSVNLIQHPGVTKWLLIRRTNLITTVRHGGGGGGGQENKSCLHLENPPP